MKMADVPHSTRFVLWRRLGETAAFQWKQFLRRAPESRITFCIAHFNSPDFLEINLQAIRRFYPDAHIIVSDALSAWSEYCAAKAVSVRYGAVMHPLVGRYRHTGLLNYMFRKVRTPIAVFFDQDCMLLDRLDDLFQSIKDGRALIGPSDNMPLTHPNYYLSFPSANRQLRSAPHFVHASFMIVDVPRVRAWSNNRPFHWHKKWGAHPLERYYGITQLVRLKQADAIQLLDSYHTGYGLGMVYVHAGRPIAYHNWYSGRIFGQQGNIDSFDIAWLQQETARFLRDHSQNKLNLKRS